LIDDLLDLAKVESGHLELEESPFELAELVSSTTEMLAASAHAKGLELSSHISPFVSARLVGDAKRLRQVLVNLLHNAIKFTDRGSVALRVEPDPAEPRPGALSFTVTDTGVGIPAEMLEVIFERFTQVDSSPTRREGTGLGLAIAKHLVELLGGSIRVSSTPGVGSRFSFTARFRVPTAAEVERTALLPPQATRDSGRALELLLVEDSADNRMLIQAYLKHPRFSIDVAQNGAEAIEAVRARPYDLVLMDVEMPLLDGYQATRAIRQWETESGRPATPIIALTAYARKDDEHRSLAAGCTAHLSKPVSKPDLLAVIARHARAGDRSGQDGKIVLHIAEQLADLVPLFLENRARDVAEIDAALERGDFGVIRLRGHSMRGSGGGYGFDEISLIGERLEHAAAASDAAEVRRRLGELTSYLERVQVVYV
jgi:hypothetical protein